MTRYPLSKRAVQAGAVLGVLAWIFSGTPLAAYAVLVLCTTTGLTWRRNEAPIFPFIFVVQWVQVTSGYFFWLFTAEFPAAYPPGDVEYTLLLALTGLLVLALGIRVSEAFASPELADDRVYVHNLPGLFWLVMGLYSINYLSVLNTKAYGSLDVMLERLLLVRQVPLLLLWFEVLRQKQHRVYLWASLAWVFIPALGSYFSDFKTPLLLALIVSATAWRPWERGWWRFSTAATVRSVAIVSAVIFLTLTWQAGVKREARKAYDANIVGSSPRERVELFLTNAATTVPIVVNDTQNVIADLVSRVWYVVFFSRVLEHVPAVEPYANGELLDMAITNTVMPRYLFPNKPTLPSDSYYTRRFAGIDVAETTTSISIGYMAEFYSDWGLRGMFLSILFYGAAMGLAASLIRRVVQPTILVNPALITVLLTVLFFEHQFIKTLAALTVAFIITIGLIRVFRDRFARFLDLRIMPEPEAVPAPVTKPGLRPRRASLRPSVRRQAL